MKQSAIAKVLEYFSNFAYYPTLEEIYTFLPKKIDKMKLKIELKRLKYTPPQYSMAKKISKRKLENWKFKIYIRLLSLAPQIKLIGLSGSISMMNAKEDDDIDLFIITAKNRLFTGRFISLLLAQLIGIRRNRFTYSRRPSQLGNKNKVCLNLFFDESNLKVPKFKQTLFVGHEVLQMKPIVNKDNIYGRFLASNSWVFKIFPNADGVIPAKAGIQSKYTSLTFNFIEKALRKFQLSSINRHRTTELITDSQLWFHPDDFEKKLQLK